MARSRQMGRWALLALLLLAQLLNGVYDEQTLSFLAVLWQRLLAASGLHHLAAAIPSACCGWCLPRPSGAWR
ncbi:hypothetical protein ACFP2F_00760 [Hymenobacter artigasi]|uniref:Uncharacterized protein n=1 Tax=Hymenobacter artigasi TaxID=2719616 RepID=A0ABX1HF00_9BACT|nr:hypothetical protein [Hymenobacter artigasi]NKI87576.1 hypothetical protein [Hymenobacter artigasi]